MDIWKKSVENSEFTQSFRVFFGEQNHFLEGSIWLFHFFGGICIKDKWCGYDILLRSLSLDEASEEVDEDDAKDEGEDVHNEDGKGPPVQAGHHNLTGEKRIWCK